MQPQTPQGTPYDQMSNQQKIKFVFKVIACVLSFGFIFPNVMGD